MSKALFVKPELCTGCNCCALACSAAKTGAYQPAVAHLHVSQFVLDGFSMPAICFQCPKAPCRKACPEEALVRDANDVILVDAEKCTACGECVDACPYGMIRVKGEVAQKCDLCAGAPECVAWCEPGALVFEEPSKKNLKSRGALMKYRSEEGVPAMKRRHLAQAVFQESRGTE